jgi:hypothetical protein
MPTAKRKKHVISSGSGEFDRRISRSGVSGMSASTDGFLGFEDSRNLRNTVRAVLFGGDSRLPSRLDRQLRIGPLPQLLAVSALHGALSNPHRAHLADQLGSYSGLFSTIRCRLYLGGVSAAHSQFHAIAGHRR